MTEAFQAHAFEAFERERTSTESQMPVMDGLEATRQIRTCADRKKAQIPIIAMTANAFDEDVKRCLEAGMDAHLSKPLQMNQIMETLAKYCGKQ